MDLHQAFSHGARRLVTKGHEYAAIHRQYGITPEEWHLLTQREHWTPDESRSIRSILATVIEACLTISGMPPVSLPGQYVAACIAILVSPANRMIACMKAPDTFDGIQASGLQGTSIIKKMEHPQLMGLVIAYSAEYPQEPQSQLLPEDVKETTKKETAK